MRDFLPEPLILLARELKKQTGKPLYLVGGCVRDFLAGFPLASSDFDLCAPVPAETFKNIATACGFRADATYARTGTVKISKITAKNTDGAKKDIENKVRPSSVRVADSNSPCLPLSGSTAKKSPPRGSLDLAENCTSGGNLWETENKVRPSSVRVADSFPPGGSLDTAENCVPGGRLLGVENKVHPSSVTCGDTFPRGGRLDLVEKCAAGGRLDLAENCTSGGNLWETENKVRPSSVRVADSFPPRGSLDKVEAEYAAFRSDKYIRGEHTPEETFFTEDISLDARRRDFACNAIYYDISADSFVDPLGGIDDVNAKRLRTADAPDKVFGEDGLRLLRLARFAGTTGFIPTAETIASAKKNAELIADIAPERVFAELKLILAADEKYGNERGVYEALKILDETRVLDGIFPELTAGRNLKQRADFHDHDVLEHSLRAAAYSARAGALAGGEDVPAPFEVRLAALLHDIGKPAAYFRDGKFSDHPNMGAEICRAALTRLKAPVKTIAFIENLTRWHMYDYDLKTKENKLRKFIVSHYDIFTALLLVKQADYSACKDNLSPAPCVIRLKNLEAKMRAENVPFSLKELAVRGNEIAPLLPSPRYVGATLNELLLHCAMIPSDNVKERLLRLAAALAEGK